MSRFVQQKEGQLVLNNSVFRFASFNTPNLHILEDPWQRISPFEQKDQIASIAQLGGQVVRTYVFSIPKKEPELKHIKIISGFQTINCKWELNEDLMHDFDYAVNLANEYGIKMIIPFIDNWEWFGGIQSFTNLYGLHKQEFFTNHIVRAGFKELIAGILNRKNRISGILYKDDPAILCWELGNELEPTPEWTLDIAKYIKSIDNNHLIMDSSNGQWTEDVLESEHIDILTNHYYPGNSAIVSIMKYQFYNKVLFFSVAVYSAMGISFLLSHTPSRFYPRVRGKKYRYMMLLLYFIGLITSFWFINTELSGIPVQSLDSTLRFRLYDDIETIKPYKKAFIVGEFGFANFEAIKDFQLAFLESRCSGILMWSLRFHSPDGGFRIHRENQDFSSYHYPGFPESEGFPMDEMLIVKSMIETNKKLRVPRNLTIPDPPILFTPQIVENEAGLIWRGATGAKYYSIQVVLYTISIYANTNYQ
ncbi:hypothetical protein HDV04_002897 [Boothiomyces sp. JEL0838]|nr:hypothetical protein HDV04_002897 [Boothiomyces sp. JEL0838]